MSKRKFYKGEVCHVCQMTQGKVVLFYTIADYLVFFTLYCSIAEKMGITVLALCPMPDHIHHVVAMVSQEKLSIFVREYSRVYAYMWNGRRNRRGPLFYHSFGSSVKLGNKQVRTTLAYNYNNPTERKLVSRAEEYRWNFLAYASSANPFSEPLDTRHSSSQLRQVVTELRILRAQGKSLNYGLIQRLSSKLPLKELQQFIDCVINLWNVIDYTKAISYYGSLETMIRAFHDNTGSEYDIKEDRDNYSDTVYADCSRILLKEKLVDSLYEIPLLPMQVKLNIYRLLTNRTSATPKQLRKYLHIPAQEVLD